MSRISTTDPPKAFPFTRQFTVMMAAVFTLVGVLTLVGGSIASLGWVEAIGATLLSVGLVTLVTEYFLRSIFTHELLDLVHLRDSVVQSGFVEAAIEAKTDWEEVYKRSRQITLLLPDPRGWLSREWGYVLDAAARQACDVRIYLPDDKNDLMLDFGALTFGMSKADYGSTLSSTDKKISHSWATHRLHPGSEISVYRLTDPATYALAGFDDSIAFILHNVSGGASVRNLTVRFGTETNNAVQLWARDALSGLASREYELYYEARKAPDLKPSEETR